MWHYHLNFFESDENTITIHPALYKRLTCLRKYIKGGSLIDIGCNEGFYCFGFHDICNSIYGCDHKNHIIQESKKIQNTYNITNVEFGVERAPNINRLSLQQWDHCLYLSLHHHIISQLGWSKANAFLQTISQHCNNMYFDMGQSDKKPSHWAEKLSKVGNIEEWMRDYLLENTDYNTIELIGAFPSLIPLERRLLWHLTKQ